MIKSFPHLDAGLPVVEVRGYLTLPPAIRRPSVAGRVIWGLVGGFVASFFMAGPLMWMVAFMNDVSKVFAALLAVLVLTLPFIGVVFGATILATLKAPRRYPPLYDTLLLFGHDSLPMLLPPSEYQKLELARNAYHAGQGDSLIRYLASERRTEFRISTVQAINITGNVTQSPPPADNSAPESVAAREEQDNYTYYYGNPESVGKPE